MRMKRMTLLSRKTGEVYTGREGEGEREKGRKGEKWEMKGPIFEGATYPVWV